MNADRLRTQIALLQRAVDRLADALAQPKNEYLLRKLQPHVAKGKEG